MLWVFPSFGAVWILAAGRDRWLQATGWRERLEGVTLEQWISLAILLAHGVFVALALHYRRARAPLTSAGSAVRGDDRTPQPH